MIYLSMTWFTVVVCCIVTNFINPQIRLPFFCTVGSPAPWPIKKWFNGIFPSIPGAPAPQLRCPLSPLSFCCPGNYQRRIVGRPEWILMLHVFVFSQSQAVSPDFSASVVFRTLSFSPRPTFWPIYAVLTVWTKWGKKIGEISGTGTYYHTVCILVLKCYV